MPLYLIRHYHHQKPSQRQWSITRISRAQVHCWAKPFKKIHYNSLKCQTAQPLALLWLCAWACLSVLYICVRALRAVLENYVRQVQALITTWNFFFSTLICYKYKIIRAIFVYNGLSLSYFAELNINRMFFAIYSLKRFKSSSFDDRGKFEH